MSLNPKMFFVCFKRMSVVKGKEDVVDLLVMTSQNFTKLNITSLSSVGCRNYWLMLLVTYAHIFKNTV